MVSQVIKTSVSQLYVDNDGIVHMTFPVKNIQIEYKDAYGIYEGRKKLLGDESKQKIIVDLRNNPKPNKEARRFAKSDEVQDLTIAMAVLVGGPMSKILGNFFLGFNRGKYPVKAFTDEKEALIWLKNH